MDQPAQRVLPEASFLRFQERLRGEAYTQIGVVHLLLTTSSPHQTFAEEGHRSPRNGGCLFFWTALLFIPQKLHFLLKLKKKLPERGGGVLEPMGQKNTLDASPSGIAPREVVRRH